ncbi:gliding motility-associated C-terminal domain-containing protein [Echinicola marina]|uniref:T9SS type B sorting domain-containing protein n=1 Tax=Echinicola marina TaxID=2859768 RepID=UPI001CF697B3|nr:gliding motility-associated C-terminal domain-containing protein [Echinicola marina]UCS93751.1 gliding motility-associated C-terminal domain-containing protein [Echinicola marina]
MKRTPIYINFRLIYIYYGIILCLLFTNNSFSQGYNNNEWIFGYCGPGTENNYISFGKGDTPNVNTLPGSVVVGQNNNAIAIDPITGEPLFYTNGELVYNYLNEPIQGAPNGINGDFDGSQTVAIAPLNYDPEGEQTYYTFYLSPSGQLQYAVMDMNAQGSAPANSPPAGEVSSLDQVIGPASGAVTVVKTPDSPSYLISFEGGELVSREINDVEGDFIITDNQVISNTPERMVFDESTGKLIIIPGDPSSPLTVLDFDTGTGTFSNPQTIDQSIGAPSSEYGGASLSPDGNSIYFSKGNELLRIPIDDLSAAPEIIPTPPSSNTETIEQIMDVKVGPDGQLYYIYQESNNDAYYVGTLENPDETDPTLLTVDENPFNGTDFCGGIFPSFAPNSDLDVSVDFTWMPQMPCMNNPLQLTSLLNPPNIPVSSYAWEVLPPPTDQDGEEIELDLTEEHLLLPADATGEQNITVNLTVTLADGSTETVSYPITFQENNLQASFTPSDTTTCLTCLDLNEMLDVQSGEEGQGGGSGGGGIGGGGQGGGSTYEYFWSNKKEEGWIAEGANEVCEPGTYWVLAREPGSSCYVYAETTVKMWDPVANEKVNDQTNNIWYFGNGAGLDFNPDPDDPNAPVPRPVEDPGFTWDLPAGTTTISDQAGQVLFYTDGQTVWDLNGNPMQGGEDIGGDNSASQSVIAVKVPQEQTLYYLFTTESASGGSNQVKFSLVDIKGENQQGIGSVVSGNNFLFDPATEQSAAISSGDTTWVMFHEMGNNTFRAYPVTSQGVGQSINSSVGSNHDFGTGVGAMKFSPDGEKLAVTVVDANGCSKVDVFDFDEQTGELSEYATIDLGCDDEVYGLEFGSDSNKIFVSYQNGEGIEEIPIQGVTLTDDTDPNNPVTSVCPNCFENANSQAAIEQCIQDSRTTLSGSSGSNLGALQMGPDGQIYVSVVGAPQVGTIQPGNDCNTSFYNEQGPTTSLDGSATNNLGLPSYVQNSGSNVPDPEIAGPDRVCLEDGQAFVEFEGAGEPDIDFYNWTITDSNNATIFTYSGEGDDFQNMEYTFDSAGVYTVLLDVERCGNPDYYAGSLEIEVVAPPTITLQDDITLCAGNTVTLTAIDGYDPNEGLYTFEWINAQGEILGDSTSNSIDVSEESIYTVTVNHIIPADADSTFQSCPASSSVFVGPAFDFELTQDAEESCYEENYINFAPDTPVSGEWSYQVQGSTDPPTMLGTGFEWEINVESLPGPDLYDIIFRAEDPILPGCVVEKRVELRVDPLPEFTTTILNNASDCATADGSFEITMMSDAQTVTVEETGDSFTNVTDGQTLGPITDLLPGVYTITAENDGCKFIETVSIENQNPPAGFEYTVTANPEECDANGIANGSLIITLTGNISNGSYTIINEDDGEQLTGTISGSVTVPLSDGTYALEVSDPNNCAVPDPQNYVIDPKVPVGFTVPSNPVACEAFYFTPEPAVGINYTITGPAGTIISPEANGVYILDIEGLYTVFGEDPNGIDCPRTREMNLTINDQVQFTLPAPDYDCDDGALYTAELGPGLNPSDYIFLWRNSIGEIVGRNQSFSSSIEGNYSLDVQPKIGTPCPQAPIEFVVEPLPENVDIQLNLTNPICDGNSVATLTATYPELGNIQAETRWFTVDNNNISTYIPGLDGMDEITVTEPGTYRVRLIAEAFGRLCSIGNDKITVLASENRPPILDDTYTICAIEGVTETLDSLGNWDTFEWYLDDELVSTDSIFTPTLPGNYTLMLSDIAGCSFVDTFEVIEDCRLRIVFPEALIPEDPNRNFVVYVNDFVDEISVLIYNRWGELIKHCIEQNVPGNSPFCTWDGTVNGKKVPVGTYPVIIKFNSEEQNIERTIKKAIVVVE